MTTKTHIIIPVFIILLLPLSLKAGPPGDGEALFNRAGDLYKEGKPEEAVPLYEEVLEAGYRDWRIYYNLGNAYVKSGKTGRAILSYRRAQYLNPRCGGIEENLEIVRSLKQDKEIDSESSRLLNTLLLIHTKLNLNESTVVCSGLFFMFTLSIILLVCCEERAFLRYCAVACGILLAISGISLAKKVYDSHFSRRAIVLKEEIDVRSGPGSDFILEFQLHEGTEVTVEDEKGEWALVRLSEDMKGWTPDKGIEEIRDERYGEP